MAVLTRTVKSLKDGVAALLTRPNLNSVNNLNNALERALRTFSQKATIPEAMTSSIVTLYDGIINYPAVSPMFGSTIKDARPVGQNRFRDDMVTRLGGEDFDRTKNDWVSGYKISFETENGVNLMKIKSRFVSPKAVLDPMNATTGWSVGGSASALAQDVSFYYKSPASLRFTLTGASSGYIERTLSQTIDMTSYLNVGVVFLALEIPSTSLTSVELRLGSSNANYYRVTVTQAQLGAWIAGDFSPTAFDLSTSTVVGNPDITKINYVRLTFATTATLTNIRGGYLWVSLPSQHKILFTTSGIFSAGGVISNYITDDSDTILLNDAAYNIYEHECAVTVGIQEGGSLANGIISTINASLNGARARNGQVIQLGLYDLFRAKNPSEDIVLVGNWYFD